MADVDDGLRKTFRSLITGAAPWPLYLWGPAGTGKTSAALVLLDYCGEGSWRIDPDIHDFHHGYTEMRSLAALKIGAENGRHSYEYGVPEKYSCWPNMLRQWRKLPLVVVDEIGVGGNVADFKLDTLLEVLNTRCDSPVRPMVVTSNLDPVEVERVYDDRVASRILAGTVYKLTGDDRRIAKAKRDA